MDIRLTSPDIEIINGAPTIDDGLETSVFISLFTDRKADNDDIPPDGSNNLRGYWGDGLETDPLGSRLWLLDRSKINQKTLDAIQTYSSEALEWMITDKIASEIRITVERDTTNAALIKWLIEIVKPNGKTEELAFEQNWNAQENN